MTASFAAKRALHVTLIFATLFGLGWSQNASNASTSGSSFTSTAESPKSTTPPDYLLFLQACSKVAKPSCSAPPQPMNGEWKLHPDFCKEGNMDCKVPAGTGLELGTELIYTCPTSHRIKGHSVVYCRHNRKWSSIPSCIEIRCDALNSVSRTADCFLSNRTTNCDFPVLPKTRAHVSCRPGYIEQVALLTPPGNNLTCNENGDWEPRPMKCSPDCGRVITHQTPLLANGVRAKQGNSPWHASVYLQTNSTSGKMKTVFICGATLIRDNLLLTAAHCVYDENHKTTKDPEELFVMTGNIFEDYDSPLHNTQTVQKAAVKNVYLHYYYGLAGNFASDIALVELKEPFALSAITLPVCLDASGNSAPHLEPGAMGRIAGFRRIATRKHILQTITVPYVSYSQCVATLRVRFGNIFATEDKFCGGYANGTAICQGDSGAGLVFQKNKRWYIMGIASVSIGDHLDDGEVPCDTDPITLYTKVSDYADWILQVISDEEQRKSRKPSMTLPTTTPTPPVTLPLTTPSSQVRSSCLVPPQPANGRWESHPSSCVGDTNCKISQGTELEPGSQLIYSCNDGYRPTENPDVYCRRDGSWSSFAACVKISCGSLNSPSVSVECRNRTGSWINCDPSVPPQTWAVLSCRLGYREFTTTATQTHRVFCNKAGRWEPEPIQCLPDCGKTITQFRPHVVNGTSARTGEFPWHASIYVEKTVRWSKETKRDHICGATIIQPNLLLTAAHCVYDANAGVEQDPKKLFIMAGNIFRDYDYAWHNPVSVYPIFCLMVKNVYRHCKYYGQPGAYASDIALIELQEPFELSNILLPACLHRDGHDEQILDHGAIGRVAGFGRTAEGPASGILQTITVPYIPYLECKTSAEAKNNKFLISDDKFCAGYNNGSAVCDGDSGGGLVFQIGELWHVMGIVSVGLGVDFSTGEQTCDTHSYTLYTRVSRHIIWIRKIIRGLHLNTPFASCDAHASLPHRKRRDSLHQLV